MEVDPSTNVSEFLSMPSTSLPKIDEDSPLDNKTPKQRIEELLDSVEGHVERIRREAIKLEEERDALLASLDSIRNADVFSLLEVGEKDEVLHYMDRIVRRCHTIELQIHTQRDQPQEEALHQVNRLIDMLVVAMKEDPDSTKDRCIAYMNACSSQIVHGHADKRFEVVLLGCTIDDQKRVKKRLQGLLSYIDKLNISSDVD